MTAETDRDLYLPIGQHDHERSDVQAKGILWFLAGLVVVLLMVSFGLAWLFDLLKTHAEEADAPPPPLVHLRQTPEGPLLQASPLEDMQALRDRENEILNGESKAAGDGLRRLSIAKAMQRVAQQGLPKWPAVEAPAEAPQEVPPPGAKPDQTPEATRGKPLPSESPAPKPPRREGRGK